MKRLWLTVIYVVVFGFSSFTFGQVTGQGNLFIIGGGKRPPSLMKAMIEIAGLSPADYIAVLPMASAETDTSFYYFAESLKGVTNVPILNFNADSTKLASPARLDSLRHARLIFITGGDQSRFMQIVFKNGMYRAIREAFQSGSCIAGTSAGAAVMSEQMITGAELLGDTSYDATYKKLWAKNMQTSRGLGLLEKTIVDQHFIVRSRYNRLLSALASFPTYTCIGVDESTAINVHGRQVKVYGNGQVVVMSNPRGLALKNQHHITMTGMRLIIYAEPEKFTQKPY
jgi:cyanophycinase